MILLLRSWTRVRSIDSGIVPWPLQDHYLLFMSGLFRRMVDMVGSSRRMIPI